MPRTGPRRLPDNFVAQAFRGLTYPLEAIGFISRHNLWGLTIVSIAVNVVLLVGLIAATIYLAVPWLEGVEAWLLGLGEAEWLKGVLQAASWIAWALGVLVIIAANALLLLLIGQAVASPFLDMLSERIEAIVLGTQSPPFSVKQVVRSIALSLSDLVWSLIFAVVINVPLFLLGMVTVVGVTVSGALSICATALLLAQEFMTAPLTRRLVSYRRRFSVVWQNRWLGLGFGVTVMGLMLIPGLNVVLLPLAAAGGTLAYTDLQLSGRLGEHGPQPVPNSQAA